MSIFVWKNCVKVLKLTHVSPSSCDEKRRTRFICIDWFNRDDLIQVELTRTIASIDPGRTTEFVRCSEHRHRVREQACLPAGELIWSFQMINEALLRNSNPFIFLCTYLHRSNWTNCFRSLGQCSFNCCKQIVEKWRYCCSSGQIEMMIDECVMPPYSVFSLLAHSSWCIVNCYCLSSGILSRLFQTMNSMLASLKDHFSSCLSLSLFS